MGLSRSGPSRSPPPSKLLRLPIASSIATATSLLPSAVLAEEVVKVGEFTPRGVTPEDTVVFVLGCIPFLWATVEFWRRIAVGDAFGTGADSVIINDTSGGRKNPVRRVLGKDAIIAARILFALAFGSVVLVAVAFFDVTAG